MIKKLGRKPTHFNSHHLRSFMVLQKHLNILPPPPANSSDYIKAVNAVTNGNWGMDGNDLYGDCTCADVSHQLMLWTANVGTILIPTAAQTLALYSAATGFDPTKPSTDQGAEIAAICDYVEKNGHLGHKLTAYAPIDPTNISHVMWAIQMFGTVKIGVDLPDSAETQFDNNEIWDVVPGATSVGGHDVCLCRYHTVNGELLFDCVTWGKTQTLTLNFFKAYCNEVIAPLSPDWISASGQAPSCFNVNFLQQELMDLKAI